MRFPSWINPLVSIQPQLRWLGYPRLNSSALLCSTFKPKLELRKWKFLAFKFTSSLQVSRWALSGLPGIFPQGHIHRVATIPGTRKAKGSNCQKNIGKVKQMPGKKYTPLKSWFKLFKQ